MKKYKHSSSTRIVSPHMMKMRKLIDNPPWTAQGKLDAFLDLTFSEAVSEMVHRSDQRDLQNHYAHSQIDKQEIEAEAILIKAQAEAELIRSQAMKIFMDAQFWAMLIKTIDWKNLPQHLQAFVVAAKSGDAGAYQNFQMMSELKDYVIAEKQAEVRIKETGAEAEEHKTRAIRAKTDKTIHDFEKLRNKS